jgi:hypothetical protein
LPTEFAQADAFLRALDPTRETWHFRTIAEGGGEARDSAQKLFGTHADCWSELVTLNSRGHGVFVVVNDGGDRDDEITRFVALFIDLDARHGQAMPAMFPVRPSFVVESSPNSHHCYWLTEPHSDRELHRRAMKALAAKFSSDPNICNPSRIMRLPGTVHRKSEPFLARTVAGNMEDDYARHDVHDLIAALGLDLVGASRQSAAPAKGEDGDPPSHPVPEGARNMTLTCIAGSLRRAGLSELAMRAALLVTNRERCLPPLADAEVAKITESIAKRPAGTLSDPVEWGLVDMRKLANSEPILPGQIMQGLPEGAVTLLGGHGGSGKSFITLEIAGCVALGLPFCGLPTRKSRALFVSCEDPVDVLHWRLSRICDHHGIKITDLVDHLDLLDLTGHDAIVYLPPSAQGLNVPAAMGRLQAIVNEVKPGLVVLDGASDTFGGDEVRRLHVTGYVNMLKGLKTTVMVISHVDKLTAKSSQDSPEAYSGSTAWNNAVRSRWTLLPDRTEDGDSGRLVLANRKLNSAASGVRIVFEWDEIAQMFVGKLDGPPSGASAGMLEETERGGILAALKSAMDKGIDVPAAHTGRRTALHVLREQVGFPATLAVGDAAATRRFWRRIEQLRQSERIDTAFVRRVDRHQRECFVLPCVDASNATSSRPGNDARSEE